VAQSANEKPYGIFARLFFQFQLTAQMRDREKLRELEYHLKTFGCVTIQKATLNFIEYCPPQIGSFPHRFRNRIGIVEL